MRPHPQRGDRQTRRLPLRLPPELNLMHKKAGIWSHPYPRLFVDGKQTSPRLYKLTDDSIGKFKKIIILRLAISKYILFFGWQFQIFRVWQLFFLLILFHLTEFALHWKTLPCMTKSTFSRYMLFTNCPSLLSSA